MEFRILTLLFCRVTAAGGLPAAALAAAIADYVARHGLPLVIADLFDLHCYWKETDI